MTAKKDLNKIIAEREKHQKAVRHATATRLQAIGRQISEDRSPSSFLYSRDLQGKSNSNLATCCNFAG
ncbi:hypothetical protein QEH52_02055 [Coraliomargarita sp. SDUM461003]|uniref:Uncharacterized protein n=1 Tax=Thalassobacterium maritimum TaxID=3041265 RepID=A0ABU1ASQ3_9BACT|nr:hypothetical protein [Coraliomargarita sp. SDUM461003]MDQ8206274.1 hypothetical protein [Coraliomargarita sp. SDUM461003]